MIKDPNVQTQKMTVNVMNTKKTFLEKSYQIPQFISYMYQNWIFSPIPTHPISIFSLYCLQETCSPKIGFTIKLKLIHYIYIYICQQFTRHSIE